MEARTLDQLSKSRRADFTVDISGKVCGDSSADKRYSLYMNGGFLLFPEVG